MLPGNTISLRGGVPLVGNDANTVLLLHFDGANGSQVVIDKSPRLHGNATFAGAGGLSTAQSKFGGASWLDSANNFISYPNHADWEFGAGDFTVDWLEYRSGAGTVICRGDQSAGYQAFMFSFGATRLVYMTSAPGAWDIANGRASWGAVTNNVWTHLAITRQGTTFRAFKDGALTDTWTSALALMAGQGMPLIIGAAQSANYNGYIDELRISKGIARWTAAFTPPTAPYGPDFKGTTLTVTGAGTWTVPADWNNASNSIECIGAGGGGSAGASNVSGGNGGGGGAYAKIVNANLTPGANVPFSVGAATGGGPSSGANGGNGGDSWFGASSFGSAIVGAKGGAGGFWNSGPASGGPAGSSIGTTLRSGGAGGYNGGAGGSSAGGGAGGPNGTGGAGGNWVAGGGGPGGGGNGGGAAGQNATTGNTGGTGGNNSLGAGGGASGSGAGSAGGGGGGGSSGTGGGAGGSGTDILPSAGSGGGAGAASAGGAGGGVGGPYGGGGGAGSASGPTWGPGGNGGQGVIIIRYT